MINEILEYNKKFVAEKGYEQFLTDKYPNRRIAIVTCMDTRLVALLPAALGFKPGDVKVIKMPEAPLPIRLTARCAACLWQCMSWESTKSW